jgi:uncharacterized protein DUF1579
MSGIGSSMRRTAVMTLAACAIAAVSVAHEGHDEASKPAKVTAVAAAKTDAKATKTEMKTDPAHDAMMAEMMKLGAPGPNHARLKTMEGKWKAVVKSWFAPGEPTVSEGMAENQLVLGGRFLEQEFKGTMMDQPFEGYGLTGYDNKKNVFTTLWIDNMGTAMTTGNGSIDAAGKELTVKSISDGPDGKPMEMKLVTRMVDANKHVFSMYGLLDGKEQLMMEITYTRL